MPAERPRRRPALPTLTRATIVTNVAIVVTGALVRLTGSGLGCPRWPTCDGQSVVPRAAAEEAPLQQALEFGNRLFSGVVLAVAIWTFLRLRRERPDLVRLGLLVPAGVVGQAVLGGVTVLTGLDPVVVAGHFLVSMAILVAAVVQDDAVRRDLPTGALRTAPTSGAAADRAGGLRPLVAAVAASAAVTLVLGTLVTAAGPHAGDPGTPRLGLDIRTVALLHADSVWLLVGLTLALVVATHLLADVAPDVRRGAVVVLVVEVAQGAVGYTQYALGIPATLVAVHVLLASVLWVAIVTLLVRTRAVAAAREVAAQQAVEPLGVA